MSLRWWKFWKNTVSERISTKTLSQAGNTSRGGGAVVSDQRGESGNAESPVFENPVQVFETILAGSSAAWALFKNGTCVKFDRGSPEVVERAKILLREIGLVVPGTPLGDFGTHKLKNFPGWIVTSHHPDVMTYVSPAELAPGQSSDLHVGLLGRNKRNHDANELYVIHVAGG